LIDLSADERARGFAIDGGPAGCLLLHGFTGTPSEMRPLGQRLAARGYTVCAPLLPGHGTRVDELARTTWEEWFSAALESWSELGKQASERVVAGLSMGALLAHVRRGDVARVHSLRRGAAEAIEGIVHSSAAGGSRVVGQLVGAIRLPEGTTIGAVVRGEDVLMAHHDTKIEADDHLILFLTDKRQVEVVEKLFQTG